MRNKSFNQKSRRRQTLLAAALVGLTGCASQARTSQVVCDTACDTPVQRAVTTAWEADRAGDGERALAGYLEVLAEDPNNKWAAARVEDLSSNLPKNRMVAKAAPVAVQQQPATQVAATPPARPAAEPPSNQGSAVAASAVNPFADFAAGSTNSPSPSVESPVAKNPTFGPTVQSANPFATSLKDPFLADATETAGRQTEEPAEAPQGGVQSVGFDAGSAGRDFRDLAGPANTEVLSLLADLSSPHPEAKRVALERLSLLGSRAAAAMPAVELLMASADEGVRVDAAWTAYQIVGQASKAVPSLIAALNSGDESVRARALRALGLIGPDAAVAVTPLRDFAASRNGVESVRAVEAWSRIDPTLPDAPRMLIESCRFGRETVRAEAVYAMGSLPASRAEEIVPALTNALHDDAESVRTAAALTLGHFGAGAESSRRALEAAARFDTEPVRDAARASLACMP